MAPEKKKSWAQKAVVVAVLVFLALGIADSVGERAGREELSSIPDSFTGIYYPMLEDLKLSVGSNGIRVHYEENRRYGQPDLVCVVEEVVYSPGGRFFFKGEWLNVVCDKASTDRHQRLWTTLEPEEDATRPEEFRLLFYLKRLTYESVFEREIRVELKEWGLRRNDYGFYLGESTEEIGGFVWAGER